MEEQNKNKQEKPKSFGKSFIRALIFGLLVFWIVRSCFSKDEPTKVYTLAKVSGKLVDGNYVININLLDSNENMIILDDKKLYKGYSARIFMFENDSWYGFDYDFKELNDKNLKSCILDTTVKLQNVKIKRNSMVLTLPKKEKINRSSTAWFAYQLIDPKGKIIGEGNADYSDFKFEIDQEKSSDYEITLLKDALVVKDAKLSNDYIESEISAEEKYKDKLVEVSGRIDDLGKSLGKIYYVLHGDGLGIECYLVSPEVKEHKDKYINLKRGDYVTIRGYVVGASENVLLENCIVK
jgi:hypothetical protein